MVNRKEKIENLPERLTKIRQINKVNIKTFAEKSGLQYTTAQNYLLGTREPTLENLRKIAEAFNVNINWLLTGKGEIFISKKTMMPKTFRERIKKDIAAVNGEVIDSLSFKDRLNDILSGKDKLRRLEVIELARKLGQPLEEYLVLSNYMPDVFDKALGNDKIVGMLRNIGTLTDEEISEVIDSLSLVLEGYMARKEKEKKKN